MLRVLLKISGEYLGGEKGFGFDNKAVTSLAKQIKSIHDKKIEVILVIGGGNFFRGATHQNIINRSCSDNIGMMSTLINGVFLQSILEGIGKKTRLMSAIEINQVAETYIQRRALRHLEKGRIVILAAGLGAPYFSTDTAAVVRAKELNADLVVKGTKVDGVYNKDPIKYTDAKKFETLTYSDVLEKNINIMDSTSITFSKENKMPIYVLNITIKNTLIDFFDNKYSGTSIEENGTDRIVEELLQPK